MQVRYNGEIHNFPDDWDDAKVSAALSSMSQPQQPQPQDMVPQQPDSLGDNTLDVLGETANAANRAIVDTLDFLGPGTINAGLRLAGSDYQMPTFGGAFDEYVPGAEGGFMEEGTARDFTRGAGSAIPAAGSLIPAAGRNLAGAGGAVAELMGIGRATPAAGFSEAGEMVQRAKNLGYPLSPGDEFGSEGMKRMESGIESFPMLFNPMHRMNATRQKVINEAASEALGVPKQTRLTDTAVGGIADDLGDEFKRLQLEGELVADDKFVNELARIDEGHIKQLFKSDSVPKALDGIIDRFGPGDTLSAVEYQDLSSELKAMIRTQWVGNQPSPKLAESLQQMVSALDDLAIDQMDTKARESLLKARREWRMLSALEKSRAIKETGDISGPLLGNYLRRVDKGGYGRGKNSSKLYEAARMSKAFPPRQDSGTADRQMFQKLAAHPVLTSLLTGGGAGAGMVANPALTATTIGIGAALPPMMANAYMYGAPTATRMGKEVMGHPYIQASLASKLFGEE